MTATTYRFDSVSIPIGLVVGGNHRLLDAWVPAHTIYVAPSFVYPQHEVQFHFAQGEIRPPSAMGAVRRLFQHFRRHDIIDLPDSAIAFDCRHDSSGNVAHVLQGQVGVALAGLIALGLESRASDLVFIVRSNTPTYAHQLFEVLGFRTIAASSAVVRGQQLWMNPDKFPLRAIAARSLRQHALASGLLSDRDRPGQPLFLARRGRRTLQNLDEIETITARHGYRTLFAEDLSIEAQIQTIANASSLFALHGAAMGFMMFRSPVRRGVVIECFPCGYPTNWARAICHLTNDLWLGGMGDLDAEVIKQRLGTAHPRAFEAMNYRIDPASAEALLSMATMAPHSHGDGPCLDRLLQHVPGVRVEFSARRDGALERFAVIDRPGPAEHSERSRATPSSGSSDLAHTGSKP